jgi:hypothetical protein
METGAKAVINTVFAVEHAFVDAVRDEVDVLFHDTDHPRPQRPIHLASSLSAPWGVLSNNQRRSRKSSSSPSLLMEGGSDRMQQYPLP